MADKKYAALIGAVLGDVLGTPYEFKSAEKISKYEELTPFNVQGRSWKGVREGAYSDDTAQILALLDYLNNNTFSTYKKFTEDFRTVLSDYWMNGKYWVDGRSFDAGITTKSVLNEWKHYKDQFDKFFVQETLNEFNAGNGSLMRAIAIPLKFDNLCTSEIYELSIAQSLSTHFNPKCVVTCCLYNNIIHEMLNGKDFKDAYDNGVAFAESYFKASVYEQSFKKLMDYEFWEYSGTGYVFDCFWSSIYAIRATKGFHEALEFCIKLGNDTDTTATVCGGIAGIIYGIDSMNPKWIEKIAGKKLIDEIYGEL